MQKVKILLFLLGILSINFVVAQQFSKIPDSLKKYSYKDFIDKMAENDINNPSNNKRKLIYAQANLLKAKKENNVEEIIYGYSNIAITLDNLELSLKYSDTAIGIAKSKMTNKLSFLYFDRGNIYYGRKKLKEALNCFLISSKDSTTTSKNLQNRINYTIGMIKNTQGNYEEALVISKRCEEIARVNEFPDYLVYLFGLAEIYNKTNHIELSEKYTNKGISLKKQYRSGDFYYPYFISNRAKNYYKRKTYNKAIVDLNYSLQVFKSNEDYSNYAESSYYLGQCYKNIHQDEKAIKYFKKVDSVFTLKNDIYPLTIVSYEYLIDHYKKMVDYRKAVYYSEQFIKADKVLNSNYKYISSKIAKNYDIQRVIAGKQAIITSLKSHKKMSLITIGLLLLGIILLGYLFYKYYKNKKKELQKQKELFEAYILERDHKKEKEIVIDELIQDLRENNFEIISEQSINIAPIKQEITEKDTFSNIDQKVVEQILNWLIIFKKEEWFLNTYTVEELAKKFNTNSSYLSRVIKATQGCSYPQHLNTLRMEYIINKLETEKKFLNYSIQGLSESSGYNSEDTFVRAFVSHTKMKPSEFVKQLKNKVS